MTPFDCYAIADSLLAGNQASRLILVDWLCDVGDEEEANFIRRTSTTRAGDLDVAIRQIPGSQAVELGCDFLGHSAHCESGLQSLLDRIRRLLSRGGAPEQFAAASRALVEFHSRKRNWYDDWELDSLDDAAHAFSAAVVAVTDEESPRAAAVALTATARLVRGVSRVGTRGKRPDLLSWQIKRTREVLGHLAMQGG